MTITLKKVLVAVAILGVLGGIGQAMTGANEAPAVTKANISATTREFINRDCAKRSLAGTPRGTSIRGITEYVDQADRINLHVQVVDSMGKSIADARCVYVGVGDSAVFLRGSK